MTGLPGRLSICLLLGFIAPAVSVPLPNISRNDRVRSKEETVEAASCFLQALKDSDPALRYSIDYPFALVLPCKGGLFDNWCDMLEQRLQLLHPKDRCLKAGRAVAFEDYLRSLGVADEEFKSRMWISGVTVVCFHDTKDDQMRLAVFVRATNAGSRVVGIGPVPKIE